MINKLITAVVTVLLLTLLALVLFGGKAEAKQKYNTTWSKSTYALQAKMIKLGFSKKLSAYIINGCKAETANPRRCVTTAAMIAKNESGAGKTDRHNNVFGFRGQKFVSEEDAVDAFIIKYNKYWYNSPYPSHYYPPKGKTAKTGYCTDEHSSRSKVGCPN
jgi:hypothetical protein